MNRLLSLKDPHSGWPLESAASQFSCALEAKQKQQKLHVCEKGGREREGGREGEGEGGRERGQRDTSVYVDYIMCVHST